MKEKSNRNYEIFPNRMTAIEQSIDQRFPELELQNPLFHSKSFLYL